MVSRKDRAVSKTWFYDAQGHDEQVELTREAVSGLDKQQLVWVDAERGDAAMLDLASDVLALDPESRRDFDTPSNADLRKFDGYFQFSVPLAPKTGDTDGRLDFVVGSNWLMTVRDGDVPYLARFREQDRGESFKGKLSPTAMAASLLDWHLEAFQIELTDIQKGVDEIDAEILSETHTRPPLKRLAEMRQRVSVLRNKLGDHAAIVHGLLRADFDPVADTPEAEHFRALERHFERTEDGIDRAREVVVGSFELYATRTAQDTNDLVRGLTVVTVIIGIAGAIAGVFGMNFETPFAKTGEVGFLAVTSLMIVIAVFIVVVAKRRKWM